MSRASRTLSTVALVLNICLAVPAGAEQSPVVVELYTSQGCSSCPPADEIFSELDDRDDVIAIALHVDYWDYIGWKDEFGQPAHAVRQRAYAAKAGRNSIYTPEMIVNGTTDIVGAKPMALSKAIAEHQAKPLRTALLAQRNETALRIQAQVPTGSVVPMEIHVLRLFPAKNSEITRGENRGRIYTYKNIAHSWTVAGAWDGTAPLDMSVAIDGTDPVVVLVQEAGAGPIIASARLD
ncbi:DUF1223 domain-containing protein [Sulfitobacter guttiformis]|uniref:Secreted protein n=1 Tax=Sulfitobacter guttiformis TaxID=74349 RepID=A0A420DJA0_9RHOB|nr:DUF1223 domain-containing protein [Sulfitobacter guttiformis]KIN71866.1 Coproporphyrinogen III oxidase [Sulfitobacter guttiformis KCTC 32187]RKE94320.1 hypothetical protein C8N30_3445 [Sulfitobacter guttiformis]